MDVFAYGYVASSWETSRRPTMSFSCAIIFCYTGESSDEDDNIQDTLKETLLETNPYLLGLTIIVSFLHSIFEFLAFKNGKARVLCETYSGGRKKVYSF